MRKLGLLFATSFFTLLLLGALGGCGDTDMQSKKPEPKAEPKVVQTSEPKEAPPAPAAEAEEDDEDKFGC